MIVDAFRKRLQENMREFLPPLNTKKKILQTPPGQSVSVFGFCSYIYTSASLENILEKYPKTKGSSKTTRNTVRKRKKIVEEST